jgi:hypothetical protein
MKKLIITLLAVTSLGMLSPAFADSDGDVAVGAVLGAGVGYAIGHQFDGRDAELAGTIIGAGVGAAIANDGDDNNNRRRFRRARADERVYYAQPTRYYYEPRHDNGLHRGWYKHNKHH